MLQVIFRFRFIVRQIRVLMFFWVWSVLFKYIRFVLCATIFLFFKPNAKRQKLELATKRVKLGLKKLLPFQKLFWLRW